MTMTLPVGTFVMSAASGDGWAAGRGPAYPSVRRGARVFVRLGGPAVPEGAHVCACVCVGEGGLAPPCRPARIGPPDSWADPLLS